MVSSRRSLRASRPKLNALRRPAIRAFASALIAVALLTTLSACTATRTHAPSLAQDQAAIAEFNRRYLKSINDGDIATLSSLTTEGHIMIPPSRPPIVGKAANDTLNGRVFQEFKIDESWAPVETVVSGDWAYQRGTFAVAATPKAGGTTRTTTGNFLRIYQRQSDGSWRMIRDMFNSDQSPAAN
jgi:ketosteroid isomerase-like protein